MLASLLMGAPLNHKYHVNGTVEQQDSADRVMAHKNVYSRKAITSNTSLGTCEFNSSRQGKNIYFKQDEGEWVTKMSFLN